MKVYQVNNVGNQAYSTLTRNNETINIANNQSLTRITADSLNSNPIAYLNKTFISFSHNNFNNDVRPVFGPANYTRILAAAGIKVKEDDEGMLILSHYDSEKVKKYGIVEKVLFDNVKEIKGNARFCTSKMKSLGKLEKIGGNVTFAYSKIRSLENLREIGGNACFSTLSLVSLGNLEKIGGFAIFNYSRVRSAGKLRQVGKNVSLGNSPLTPQNFKKVKVGGEVFKFYRNDCKNLKN